MMLLWVLLLDAAAAAAYDVDVDDDADVRGFHVWYIRDEIAVPEKFDLSSGGCWAACGQQQQQQPWVDKSWLTRAASQP